MQAAIGVPSSVGRAAPAGAWWDAYVGRAYVPGEFDCADLVEAVARDVFGRQVRFPKDRPDGQRSEGYRAQLEAEIPRFFRRRNDIGADGDRRQSGDMVLMIGAGRPNHIGVLVLFAGDAWVLHNLITARQVVLTRLSGMRAQGLVLEGVYAWT
jgi:cell wall-associated NlpC family hydrolase